MSGAHEAVYRIEHLMKLAIPYSGEDPVDALVDLITDIKLYCAVTDGIDWERIEYTSREHSEYELYQEQEEQRLNDDETAFVGLEYHGDRY